jgi:hypothetical protein
MFHANFTNIEDGSTFSLNRITEYNLDSEPMSFTLSVDVGIDTEGNEQHIITEQTFSKLEYTVEVIPDE